MKHQINVNNIRVYANHGCLAEETLVGSWYRVDIHVTTDFSNATVSDELSDTLDYVTINKIVKEQMAIPSKLIEHVGQRIMNELKLGLSVWFNLRVHITKYNPPINGDVESVSIEISEENK
ncbi:MAG: dihydroneopterin aldolase [Bacteroidetes bacterium]|nr:dihydroneopterin aldolase [Bacteroidota bacterium]